MRIRFIPAKAEPVQQHGFTLIELLIYVAIVGSLLTAVITFFAATVDSRVKNQSISEVNQQGMAAMEYITGTIRDATSITAPLPADGAVTSLTLVVPSSSLSPTLFNISGSTLQVTEDTDGTPAVNALTNSKVAVSNLTFRNLSRTSTPGVIQIKFTLSRVNPANRNEYDYQKDFTASAALRWP